jgi:hypothetical protein
MMHDIPMGVVEFIPCNFIPWSDACRQEALMSNEF